jgi:hypothetical protein
MQPDALSEVRPVLVRAMVHGACVAFVMTLALPQSRLSLAVTLVATLAAVLLASRRLFGNAGQSPLDAGTSAAE